MGGAVGGGGDGCGIWGGLRGGFGLGVGGGGVGGWGDLGGWMKEGHNIFAVFEKKKTKKN